MPRLRLRPLAAWAWFGFLVALLRSVRRLLLINIVRSKIFGGAAFADFKFISDLTQLCRSRQLQAKGLAIQLAKKNQFEPTLFVMFHTPQEGLDIHVIDLLAVFVALQVQRLDFARVVGSRFRSCSPSTQRSVQAQADPVKANADPLKEVHPPGAAAARVSASCATGGSRRCSHPLRPAPAGFHAAVLCSSDWRKPPLRGRS